VPARSPLIYGSTRSILDLGLQHISSPALISVLTSTASVARKGPQGEGVDHLLRNREDRSLESIHDSSQSVGQARKRGDYRARRFVLCSSN
jgi:hypothetical protein